MSRWLGRLVMSMGMISRIYRESELKVIDKDRVLRLIKVYADQEKIRDEAKAVTLLIYSGYSAWVARKAGKNPHEKLTKYYTVANNLIELTRELLLLMNDVSKRIEDKRLKEKLEKYAKYGGRILDNALIELSVEKE